MSGPGAMASPARRADHPQAPCSHSTIDSSIAPKDAEKKMATSDAPVKLRDRNSDGWMSGVRLRRQCSTKSAMSAADAASVQAMAGEPQPQSLPFTSPKVRTATPAVASTTPRGVGPFARVTGNVRQPAPADDEGGDPDRHVDQEDPPPADRHQQAADDRADGGGHATDRRPGPDGTVPALRRGRRRGPTRARSGSAGPPRPPGSSRKPMSMPTLVEAAQAADAAVKTATPRRKARSRR